MRCVVVGMSRRGKVVGSRISLRMAERAQVRSGGSGDVRSVRADLSVVRWGARGSCSSRFIGVGVGWRCWRRFVEAFVIVGERFRAEWCWERYLREEIMVEKEVDVVAFLLKVGRSEERRVGKECPV